MSEIKKFWIKNKIVCLVGVFVLGFMIFGGWAYQTLVAVKISGDQYKQIVQGKDLIADILPPPEYIIEAYLVTFQMMNETDRNKLVPYIERGKQLRKDFEDRRAYWEKELSDGPVKQKLAMAFAPAQAFFDARDNQFIPALQTGDTKKAKELFETTMMPSYEKHRAAIDETVPLAAERNKQDEQSAASLITSRTWQLMVLGSVIIVVVSLLCWNSLNSDKKRIQVVAARGEQLSNLCITSLQNATESMAKGDLQYQMKIGTPFLDISGADEIGTLENTVNTIIKQLQATVAAFEKSRSTVLQLVEETNRIAREVSCGNLTVRSDQESFEGTYQNLMQGVNRLVQGVSEPLTEVGDVLQRLAAQDLTTRMMGNYQGEYEKLKTRLNNTTETLAQTMMQVSSAAEQVNSAANEINSGSQSLAQGASEQASSLEEVSSSLQEMSSMIKQNAANAKEARGLTEAARQSTDKGVLSMQQLSDAVNRIKQSSDATAKIVKTIDEIAFQTNLLALNAAVEAARAGDAGKGFAVVAEEVRNLAMRSAEAAKNTAELIEGSVKNAEGGVAINSEVMANLVEINKQVNQVSEVMAEIAAASDQQSQGVEQINAAIGQMNQVTQQTAANAEESAAAAEELSGQSEEMLSLVGSFQLGQRVRRSFDVRSLAPKAAPMPKSMMIAKAVGASATMKRERFSNSEDLIPFDEMDAASMLQEF